MVCAMIWNRTMNQVPTNGAAQPVEGIRDERLSARTQQRSGPPAGSSRRQRDLRSARPRESAMSAFSNLFGIKGLTS